MERTPRNVDQRQHPRIGVAQRVWCEGDDLTLYLQARDVSEGGLFVRTSHPVEAGRRFRISFQGLADEEEIVAEVEVIWARPKRGEAQPGMGLRILSFEKGQSSFHDFVARLLRPTPGHPPESH